MKNNDVIKIAREVIRVEAEAVAALEKTIGDEFCSAVNAILSCKGRIVVTGMGKSGHIGGKVAATLASTGTPAFFVHPGEASHGDLGMITKEDVVIAIAFSGETHEVISILPMLKRHHITLIAITGNSESTLAKQSDWHLNVSVEKEACPLGLAPTSSTTATLAMGDALAVSALKLRGFTAEDFALSHPGGSLGKRLLVTVGDLMHIDKRIPLVDENALITDAVIEMTQKGFGVTGVTSNKKLVSVFTDGDIRRVISEDLKLNECTISQVTHKGCSTIEKEQLAAKALEIMESKKITSLFIVDDDQQALGIIHMHDLLSAGIA